VVDGVVEEGVDVALKSCHRVLGSENGEVVCEKVLVGNSEKWTIFKAPTSHKNTTEGISNIMKNGEEVFIKSRDGLFLSSSQGSLSLEDEACSFQIFSSTCPSFPSWERSRPFLSSS